MIQEYRSILDYAPQGEEGALPNWTCMSAICFDFIAFNC